MAIELRVIIQGKKELNGVALNQVQVQAMGPFAFAELTAQLDPEIMNAEQALARALTGPISQLLRPQAPQGQILKPGFLKTKNPKKPRKGRK